MPCYNSYHTPILEKIHRKNVKFDKKIAFIFVKFDVLYKKTSKSSKRGAIKKMRLRNIRGSKELVGKSPFVIKDAYLYKGKWKDVFKNENPVHIEVGMGKGRFITTLAEQNPSVNYVGIEKYSSVLVRGIEKQQEMNLPNLVFLCEDAERLEEIFGNEEVKKIYLNFSDPWPKDRHAKRRLTSKEYFSRYEQILSKEGIVEFKTDNKVLFDFSLQQIEEANWEIIQETFDLHHSDMAIGNIMTEYEEKFSALGNPICKVVAKQRLNEV